MTQAPQGAQDDRTERRVRLADGRSLGYSEYGDPNGAPIVYFHGGASSRLDIAFADDQCRRMGARIISIDRPGMGLSEYKPGRTILDWPDDVGYLLSALHVDRCAVLGWSGATPYVLACALRLPDRVSRAATVGGMSPIDAPGALKELAFRPDRILFRLARKAPQAACILLSVSALMPPALIHYHLLGQLPEPDRRVMESLAPREATAFYFEALREGPKGVVRDYQLIGKPWRIPHADSPTEVHLWRGEHDLVPSSHTTWLAGRLARSEIIEVPSQGHFLLHTNLDQVLEKLVA
ncbi:MAG: alpha/beta fold hydrolase [Acidimicrobiales bacterium]